jgi:hypothetical protein
MISYLWHFINARDGGALVTQKVFIQIRRVTALIKNFVLLWILLGLMYNFAPGIVIAGLNDGLVAYYPLNGNTNDESGNGNQGVIYGATLTHDRYGNANSAYYFNGINNYIAIPAGISVSSLEVTVSAWVSIRSLKGISIICYTNTPGGELNIGINSDNKITFAVKLLTPGLAGADTNDSWFGVSENAVHNVNQFIHVVGKYYRGDRIEIWINGILKNVRGIPEDDLYSSPFHFSAIGAVSYGGNPEYPFNGIIDEVRVYNRALSAAEIQALCYQISINPGYLEFSDQIGSPTVGTPFPLTITARRSDGSQDPGFNGLVTLSCPGVAFTPEKVTVSNGQWSGQVSISQDGCNLVLKAVGNGLSGTSTSFDIVRAASAIGSLTGVVSHDWRIKVPIAGATVHLIQAASGTDAYPPQTTDLYGRYAFSGVASGNYYLWATYDGNPSSTSFPVYIPAWGMSQNLQIPTGGGSTKTPAILVAGMMGSTVSDGQIPSLKKSLCNRNQLQLYDYDGAVGWRALKGGLQEKGVRVIECPWDWRKPIQEAMGEALKDAIQEAKNAGYKKVNIIAHSTGGLLARAYIQSKDYQDDVENLIMVGTPHQGSANGFYIWEGGDPLTADAVTNKKYIYSLVLVNLIKDTGWPNALDSFSSLMAIQLRQWDDFNTHKFITQNVRSLRQLLPTYLCLDDKTTCRPITSPENINQDLKDLNSGANGYVKPSERMGRPDSTDNVVKTRVYFSNSEKNTLSAIKVKSRSIRSKLLGIYQDGDPVGTQVSYTSGDGTVPEESAKLPEKEGWAEAISSSGAHMSLVGNNKDKIVADLYPPVVSFWDKTKAKLAAWVSSAVSLAHAQEEISSVPPTFSVSINGWVQPYLADAQGRGVGINPMSGAMEYNLPGAVITTEADRGSIVLDNPVDGNYTISLMAQFACDYRLTIGYGDSGNSVLQEVSGFNDAQTLSLTLTVDSTSSQKIIITPPLAAPTRLVSGAADGKAKLSWERSSDTEVLSYKVYAKSPESPFFTLTGTTSLNTFMTNDPWLDYTSTLATMYVIAGVRADGTESFFSNRALNKKNPPRNVTMAPIIDLLQKN